jgi:hypothetical protein
MQQPQRSVRATEPTKPLVNELFLSPLVQTLILYRSEYTSMRSDYGGRVDGAPVPVQGRFVRRTPMKIPACWQKRSLSEGRSTRAKKGEKELYPPLPRLHPPPHRHLPWIPAWGSFLPLCPRIRPGGTPKPPLLPRCLPPFIVGMVSHLPHHILK